jgi:hypothetical protein
MMELKTAGATLVLDALTVIQVGSLAAQFLAKAPPLVSLWTLLNTALTTWVPVFGDGGTALKTALAPFIAQANALIGQISCTKAQGE